MAEYRVVLTEGNPRDADCRVVACTEVDSIREARALVDETRDQGFFASIYDADGECVAEYFPRS